MELFTTTKYKSHYHLHMNTTLLNFDFLKDSWPMALYVGNISTSYGRFRSYDL